MNLPKIIEGGLGVGAEKVSSTGYNGSINMPLQVVKFVRIATDSSSSSLQRIQLNKNEVSVSSFTRVREEVERYQPALRETLNEIVGQATP